MSIENSIPVPDYPSEIDPNKTNEDGKTALNNDIQKICKKINILTNFENEKKLEKVLDELKETWDYTIEERNHIAELIRDNFF